MSHPDLFADTYPNAPGYKARETSRQAAVCIAPRAGTIRERVLAAIIQRPGTPEQIAHRIREPIMNVRPRCSELAARGLIKDSGETGEAMGGRKATVWVAVRR